MFLRLIFWIGITLMVVKDGWTINIFTTQDTVTQLIGLSFVIFSALVIVFKEEVE